MKISTLLLSTAILFTGISASAQSIQPQTPRSMQNAAAPAVVPASSAAQAQAGMIQQKAANPELQGYSVAFLAYHYNDFCKLGLNKATIDNLATQLKDAEQQNQISQATIDKNVADADRIYKQEPTKFCSDARQVASVIQQLFAGQQPGKEQIPEPLKQMYLNQAK